MAQTSRAGWRTATLAIAVLAGSTFAMAQTQQQPKSGTEATPAMGSQVPQMKPDCDPKTASGEKQREHPPTAAMDKQVPAMTADAGCPDDATAPGAEGQTKKQ